MTTATSRPTQIRHHARYTGVTALFALIAALAALLVIVLQTGPEVTATLGDLTRAPEHAMAHTRLLSVLIAAPTLCAALAALITWRFIWVVRVTRYMRFLRAYCRDRLRRDAPLIALGFLPTAVLLDSASASQKPSRPVVDLVAAHPQALLLGSAGAGKSTALLCIAHSLNGRSLVSRLLFGVRRESLPVFVSLPGLASSLTGASASPVPYIADALTRLGTEGLGARAERLLRRGRITLLCDDYDQLDDDERDNINQALRMLHETAGKRSRIVVACEQAVYANVLDDLGPLAQFSILELAPVPSAELVRALGKRQNKRQRRRERRQDKLGKAAEPLADGLQDRPLGDSLPTAAIAAALTETLAAGERAPWGRATLLRDALRLANTSALARGPEAAERPPDGDASQQPALVWGALAASLQEARRGYLPLDPARTIGECAFDWLGDNPPPGPTDFALSVAPELPLSRIERDIQAGLRTGVLRRSLDGLALSFSHQLAHEAAAAWWLDMRDDGLGRLNSRLLRTHWVTPVALWAGAHENPHDLAERIFRFANSPSSIAPRAGILDSQEVYPQALALALAAVVEGVAPQLAQMSARQETQSHSFLVAQQALRDLLDAAVVYGADPARRQRLRRSLERAQQEVGREFATYLGRLARDSNLDRLLRAQVTSTLGLMATREALAELMPLLTQSDPTMRQAVDQALIYANARAIRALQVEAHGTNPHTQRRAEEALRMLTGATTEASEVANGAALAGLHSSDAAQRRVAVSTLSAIGASEALNELIARLDDVNGEVRLAAAAALGQLGGKRALLALGKRATSEDPDLRLAVAQALGMDPAPASTVTLLRLLKDRDARVRAAAASALGAIADKRAIGPLRQASEDADPWVRHAAQTAVRRFTRI